ncbi:hypothetical protein C8R45DRAFT_935283 [Mycena sanguinolenta]|nr:hypothetical protein C8R45DRAFT_935283 [Mycena sanguinolenta]
MSWSGHAHHVRGPAGTYPPAGWILAERHKKGWMFAARQHGDYQTVYGITRIINSTKKAGCSPRASTGIIRQFMWDRRAKHDEFSARLQDTRATKAAKRKETAARKRPHPTAASSDDDEPQQRPGPKTVKLVRLESLSIELLRPRVLKMFRRISTHWSTCKVDDVKELAGCAGNTERGAFEDRDLDDSSGFLEVGGGRAADRKTRRSWQSGANTARPARRARTRQTGPGRKHFPDVSGSTTIGLAAGHSKRKITRSTRALQAEESESSYTEGDGNRDSDEEELNSGDDFLMFHVSASWEFGLDSPAGFHPARSCYQLMCFSKFQLMISPGDGLMALWRCNENRIHGRAGNVHEQPQDSLPLPRCACPIALRTLTHESSIKFAPAESHACSNSPAYRDGFVGIQKERWQEARGVGIGTAGDAALEEISRVHRLVSRRSWKGSSLSDACRVYSVAPEPSALLRERFELPLFCAPTGSWSSAGCPGRSSHAREPGG